MGPKVLISGKGGKSGSWMIRAEQLGSSIGATVKPNAQLSDCLRSDVIVVVKRTPTVLLEAIAKSGRPWVFDIVDGWPQPVGNEWQKDQAISWLHSEIRRLKPDGMVFGTLQMQEDSQFTGPSLVLPHHAWPKYSTAVVRGDFLYLGRHKENKDAVEFVGYEGAENYLGRWHQLLISECQKRGWQFAVNGDMTRCDIGVALRDASGYPARAWKPGTKLSNLQALGLPALLSPEAGYREQSSGVDFWIEHQRDIVDAFDALSEKSVRDKISLCQQLAAPRLEVVARTYADWLSRF